MVSGGSSRDAVPHPLSSCTSEQRSLPKAARGDAHWLACDWRARAHVCTRVLVCARVCVRVRVCVSVCVREKWTRGSSPRPRRSSKCSLGPVIKAVREGWQTSAWKAIFQASWRDLCKPVGPLWWWPIKEVARRHLWEEGGVPPRKPAILVSVFTYKLYTKYFTKSLHTMYAMF